MEVGGRVDYEATREVMPKRVSKKSYSRRCKQRIVGVKDGMIT